MIQIKNPLPFVGVSPLPPFRKGYKTWFSRVTLIIKSLFLLQGPTWCPPLIGPHTQVRPTPYNDNLY